MRFLPILLIASALGSCTAGPPPAPDMALVAKQQARLADLTAGKVAGPPMSCLQSYRSNDMITINDSTLAFRQGRGTVYINHMNGSCPGLERGTTALVTRTVGTQLCRGDIAQVMDTANRMVVGSCVFGDFVPFRRAGASY